MQVAAVDDVEQLGVAAGDGGQVGVGEHDLLGLKVFVCIGNKSGLALGSPVKQVAAPHGDGAVAVIGGDPVGHAESVILEAISNAVRRSGATQLTVAVTVADELDVTITDDGCGISADNQRHSGLANMASRAEQIGGDCHVTTPPGGGTEVNWTAPFAHGPYPPGQHLANDRVGLRVAI